MALVKIYFKKKNDRNAIAARISIPNQSPFEITTRVSVPRGGDLKLERGKLVVGTHPALDDVNDKLYDFKRRVKDFASRIEILNDEVTAVELQHAIMSDEVRTLTVKDILRQYLLAIESGDIENIKTGKPLSSITIRGRTSHVKTLIEYTKKIMNLDLGKYNYKTSEIIGKSRVADTYKKFWKELVAAMYHDNLDSNTISHYSVVLKGAIRYIIQRTDVYIEPFLDQFKHHKTVYDRELLESNEYDFLINNYRKIMKDCSISEKKTFQYAYVALWTCARSADMRAWTHNNLIKKGDVHWLEYSTSKGGVSISIPLKEEVVEVFKENLKNDKWLLPRATYVMATTLKVILKRCPMFERTVMRVRIKGGKRVEEYVPLYKLLTIHKMRGSGMTAMRRNKVPDNVIKQWSSHSEESKAFSMYFQTEKKELLDTAKAFYG